MYFQYKYNPIFQVPFEDCEYLKDQSGKIGPKDTFQLGLVDKSAIKK